MDHFSEYYYSHIIRGTSYEETLWDNGAYEHLTAIHRARVCAYRADKQSFAEPQFKESVQTCVQYIRYCGLVSHHQKYFFERRIKEFNLVSLTLLLHCIRLWTESIIDMIWTFSFKSEFQRYNSLEMDEDGKTTYHNNFSVVDFQVCPTYYHTWGCPIIVL